nr:immunoglobulin heavy chain junction region [Mus musculus]
CARHEEGYGNPFAYW